MRAVTLQTFAESVLSPPSWLGEVVLFARYRDRNYEVAYCLLQPFLVKAGVIMQEDLSRLCQQMLIEMHYDDFCALWHFTSAWGEKP